MRIDVRIAAAFLLLQTTGCPLLLGVPPARVDFGSGARVISGSSEPVSVDAPAAFRVGAHPLGLIPRNAGRPFDLGVGYVLDAGQSETLQGGYLSEGLFALRAPGVRGIRVGVELQERLLTATAGSVSGTGAGFATRLDFEYADFAQGSYEEKKLLAGAYGEGAVGLFVEGDATFIGGTRFAAALSGLTFTLPAAGLVAAK
jgi:hypothetical protein